MVWILLAAMATSVWTHLELRRSLSHAANARRLEALAQVLTRAAGDLLAEGQVSALRRLISEVGIAQGLDVCQLSIPDEGVIAAADPAHISLVALPAQWSEIEVPDRRRTEADGYANLRLPVPVPGRGTAVLDLSASAGDVGLGGGLAITLQLVTAGLALLLMLGVYHGVRPRFQALGAIHEALQAVRDGSADLDSLRLDPDLGPETEAWNTLLAEKQGAQVRAALDQVRETIHAGSEVATDLSQACDVLPIGMLVVDAERRVQYANGAAAVLLQSTPEGLHDAALAETLPDADVQEALTGALSRATAPRRVMELDGDASVLRLTVRPVRETGSHLALVVIEDVTQQRVSAAARDSFLAQATHELRSPLTNIRLYVEQAVEDIEGDPAQVARSLNVINNESRRLERVVSEILSVSEIEAGSFHIDRDDVRVDTLLEQLREDHQPRAQQKGIDLVFDVTPKLPVLHADRDKIAVALHNLVSNAIKYTPEGGQVVVHVEVNDGTLCVEVRDTGLGIRPEDQRHIFNKFYRAKDRRIASITGSGLGLAISRDLVRLHGGDIAVTSEIDQGSVFRLTLPLPQEIDDRGHSDSAVRSG